MHAAKLATLSCIKNLKPYNYSPCSVLLPKDPSQIARQLRSLLVENERAISEGLTEIYSNGSTMFSSILAPLEDLRVCSSPASLALFSSALDQQQHYGRLITLALLIREGRLDDAEALICAELAKPIPPRARSRYLANMAMLQEILGASALSRKYSAEAVNCTHVSPLAVQNYTLYWSEQGAQ